MKDDILKLLEQCEAAVALLCDKSQAPHDEFDIMAMALGAAADRVAGGFVE